jgi:hypothetical protein
MSIPSPPNKAKVTQSKHTDKADLAFDDDTQVLAEAKIDTVIYSFLEAYPEPTDDQVHRLAEILGMTPEEFETRIFDMFSDELDEDEDEAELDEDEDDILAEDSIDIFLISYFTINASPTEDEVHSLAALIGLTAAELEARIYRMLAELTSDDDEDDEEDSED